MKQDKKREMMQTSAYITPLLEVVEVSEKNIICASGDVIGISSPAFGGFGSEQALDGKGVSTPGFGGFGPEITF